ncbi:hypothetical protein M1O12_00390 [Dehalococcoidia bacterium]|nr:hypothetical protein [Dehalococcoidia bacterium]MCL0102692.1 hypothetical protein [Dehalococcoidia bacterium]
MRALLIEVDFETGKRAGGIDPRDPNLRCRGWQNLDSEPGLEIRLVEDDRDLSQYAGVPGVTVLEGKDAINAAIQANFPPRYDVVDRELLLAHLREKGVSLDIFVGKTLSDVAEELFRQGFAGIVEVKPQLL